MPYALGAVTPHGVTYTVWVSTLILSSGRKVRVFTAEGGWQSSSPNARDYHRLSAVQGSPKRADPSAPLASGEHAGKFAASFCQRWS